MRELRFSSTILNLGCRWRGVVSFTLLLLYSRRKAPGTHWIGGWVGPRTGLDGCISGCTVSFTDSAAVKYTYAFGSALLNGRSGRLFGLIKERPLCMI
jgi:hypothetical protein